MHELALSGWLIFDVQRRWRAERLCCLCAALFGARATGFKGVGLPYEAQEAGQGFIANSLTL